MTGVQTCALPIFIVRDADTQGRLSPAAKSLRTRTLFSEADNVLHWAFPPGETAAFEGFFPQAVGRFGNPDSTWTDLFDLQPYDHGNYFPGLMTAGRLDDRSAQYAAQFIGASVATTLAGNQILVNTLVPSNEIGTRTLGQ